MSYCLQTTWHVIRASGPRSEREAHESTTPDFACLVLSHAHFLSRTLYCDVPLKFRAERSSQLRHTTFDASLQATVKEMCIIGSRCGPVDEELVVEWFMSLSGESGWPFRLVVQGALKFMEKHTAETDLNLHKYITAAYPLQEVPVHSPLQLQNWRT
eukprot:331548-Amphidinium_carterae.1